MQEDKDGILLEEDKIWVPDTAEELIVKRLRVVHADQADHRGVEAAIWIFGEQFVWKSIAIHTKGFVADC